MEPVCVYPGTFSPPTFGHLRIVERAARIFPRVIVVCSTNPEKGKSWFSQEEACVLWRAYPLPDNAEVMTLAEFVMSGVDPKTVIMIRGVRDEDDVEHEKDVMLKNHSMFGISQYFYIISDCEYRDISSTRAREAAEALDLQELGRCVAPLVVSAMLERVLGARNVFLVVGRPASGKSTFLRELSALDPLNIHIDTDRFLDDLKDTLRERFGTDDLPQVVLEREAELIEMVRPFFMERLSDALRSAPKGANLFVEMAYGMQPDKHGYTMVGGKVIYIGCGESDENRRRVSGRETMSHMHFIERIPGRDETMEICVRERLQPVEIDLGGSLDDMRRTAREFDRGISEVF